MANDMVRHLLHSKQGNPDAIHRIDLKEAKRVWGELRIINGFAPGAPILTPPEGNSKYSKTAETTYGLSLAPAETGGTFNVCRFSTPECRKGCVAFAGRGKATTTLSGRRLRTELLGQNPNAFVTLLGHEVKLARKRHTGHLGVRLNGFSDIPWEQFIPWLFEENMNVSFYDYTKVPLAMRRPPVNYRLTQSASERTTPRQILEWHAAGANVAVIFDTKKGVNLPETYLGIPVIDGDASDARYLDPERVIVGLRAKGAMKKGNYKMVRSAND